MYNLFFVCVFGGLIVFSEEMFLLRHWPNKFDLPISPRRHLNLGKPLILTPMIEGGEIRKALRLSKVTPDIGKGESYSGLLTVNKRCDSNLFFWFFPAQLPNWRDAPLLLWLQGGPGASSLYGVFDELGPFEYVNEGLKTREYSWNKENNLLIIDQPVGTGYSYTGKNCYPTNEEKVSEDLYEALIQIYQLFPGLRKNKFFISGESYAGHYIPALGHTIHKRNPTAKLKINLTAMMIGNGWSDPKTQVGYGNFLFNIGLIDNSGLKECKDYEKLFVKAVSAQDWESANANLLELQDVFQTYLGNVSVYNYHEPHSPYYRKWQEFINSPEVRKALHVGGLPVNFINHDVMFALTLDGVKSVKPWVEELLEFYPIVFYYGQLDLICGYPMAVKFLRSLRWSSRREYLTATRSQWCVEKGLAGYYKSAGNLHEVFVRNAGHMVPTDQPHWAYVLVNSVTSGSPKNPLHALRECNRYM